jgi:Cytochrome c554 and c-prime
MRFAFLEHSLMSVRRSRRPAVICYGAFWTLVIVSGLTFAALRGSASPATVVSTASFLAANANPVKTDPANVVGPQDCVKCHKAEHARWMKTVHYTNHKRLAGPNAAKYGAALGIAAADIPKSSLCINCHATAQSKAGGPPTAIAGIGVSCESCHGGAGGKNGWLKPHGDYGKGKTRQTETAAHRTMRLAASRKAGKVGPRELYGVAKKCFSCHIVDNEKLVNAGHKAGSLAFEFASWSNGEVRHNFQVNQNVNEPVSSLWLHPVGKQAKRNADNRRHKMYILGLMVDLETSLRNRGNATGPGYAAQMAARIGPMLGKFTQINAVADTKETKAVGAVIQEILPKVFVVKAGQKKTFDAAADKVAQAAKDFLKNHDGSKLGGLATMKMVPKAHFSKDFKP